MFDVVDISEWVVVSQEPGGDDDKAWVARPEHANDQFPSEWWVYKPVKRGATSAYRRHDDQAERAASALAALIGLPAAAVEQARRGSNAGTISRNVIPDGWEERSGDLVLSERPGYLSCSVTPRPKNRVGHNLSNIRSVLGPVRGPVGPCADWPAFDVFVGYLVFDAWIANTDRHARNWSLVVRGDDRRLAASFDHGSALASGSTDADLATRDPVQFARRGCAGRFEDGHAVTLVDLALDAARHGGPMASRWFESLAAVDDGQVDRILSFVPGVSEARRTFLSAVLAENKRRLLL